MDLRKPEQGRAGQGTVEGLEGPYVIRIFWFSIWGPQSYGANGPISCGQIVLLGRLRALVA